MEYAILAAAVSGLCSSFFLGAIAAFTDELTLSDRLLLVIFSAALSGPSLAGILL